MEKIKNLCWIRRDLRLTDHYALSEALKADGNTIVFFNFDPHILGKLPKNDRRVTFIIESLNDIEEELQKHHSSLYITYGDPLDELIKVSKKFSIENIFVNRDYEPYAKNRDDKIIRELKKLNIQVKQYKDHVFFEKHEVLTDKKEIYRVFTPYKNKWLQTFEQQEKVVPNYKINYKKLAVFQNSESLLKCNWFKKIEFEPQENILKGGRKEALKKLEQFKKFMHEYKVARDFPSLEKTSFLSPYLRMGNISIRESINFALSEKNEGAQTFLSELIWREFYQMILDVFPRVEKSAYKLDYDKLKYENDSKLFEAWKNGQTGYPIIDASMRCLNATGLMHNRLRMIVASFLTKTLLIDWKWGEAYFALKLLDFDLAANNGGWQWSASTGVDAQPYFRIFNPYNQSEKFDEHGNFIRIWCPELKDFSDKLIHNPSDADLVQQARAQCLLGKDYPFPIVTYRTQKEKALKMFKEIDKTKVD